MGRNAALGVLCRGGGRSGVRYLCGIFRLANGLDDEMHLQNRNRNIT
jgi:hypothetical protein